MAFLKKIMSNKNQIKLEPKKFYHIYNRGNNGDYIFFKEKNYLFFLEKYGYYLYDYLDTYAYSLMQNHFHLLVKVKTRQELFKVIKRDFISIELNKINLSVSKIISEKFRRFFLSYSKAINIQEKRTGSLFEKPFKRKLVNNPKYLKNLIYYIHFNPVLHKICKNINDYDWTSYNLILSKQKTKLKRKQTIDLFENELNFKKYHSIKQNFNNINDLIIEF
ncbi:MAG: hypothetical protein U9N76_05175 [Candidatus Marinimicrobia bacterium]|nr:hypothetical protein [Candidatus Neomarinimicrobiota bacterium]